MNNFNEQIFNNNYMNYILIFCAIIFVILIIYVIFLNIFFIKLKKRINKFMKSDDNNLEETILNYSNKVNTIDNKYEKISKDIDNINLKLKSCIQKIGIIRYNPYEEMGSDLCFTLSLLDENNNGVVLNSIHARESCYTYAKPIIGLTSKYKLSEEEEKAIKLSQK